MRIKPDGIDLLDEVCRTLKDDVLPAAGADQQYTLRMALNALSIVRRQMVAGTEGEEAEAIQLSVLLEGDDSDPAALQRLLAQKIRAGELDNDGDLQQVLWQITKRQTAESAPRYLKAEGIK